MFATMHATHLYRGLFLSSLRETIPCSMGWWVFSADGEATSRLFVMLAEQLRFRGSQIPDRVEEHKDVFGR